MQPKRPWLFSDRKNESSSYIIADDFNHIHVAQVMAQMPGKFHTAHADGNNSVSADHPSPGGQKFTCYLESPGL